eukprot:205163-Hanusia_phi.AAC.1
MKIKFKRIMMRMRMMMMMMMMMRRRRRRRRRGKEEEWRESEEDAVERLLKGCQQRLSDLEEQPSPSFKFPSSQVSPGSTTPLPQEF